MKWLNQFSFLMRSNLTSLREAIEDPERMLHQLILDMEEEFARVKACVADTLADEIQLKKRLDREREDEKRWLDRATQAMQRGDEAGAKLALEQKIAAQNRAEHLANELTKQQQEVARLRSSVNDLEDKLRQAKQKKGLLTARMARANSTQTIHQALDQAYSQSALSRFQRLEEKVERQEAVNEACERMDGKDPDALELERRFEAEARQRKLADELAALKAQTGSV